MNRCWIGAGILLTFLVLGLVLGFSLDRFCGELAQETELAAEISETDRAGAAEILKGTRQKWQRRQLILRVLSDHDPIDRAQTLFVLLENAPDSHSFRLTALELSQLLRELGQSQLPSWENVL